MVNITVGAMARRSITAVVVATMLITLTACESNGAKPSAASGELNTAWLFYGPKQDGGWNVANWGKAQQLLLDEFGAKYQQSEVDNVPYAPEAGQLTRSFIQGGSNILIDTVGLGDIFTKVCEKNEAIKCLETAPAGKLPANTTGYWADAGIPNYVAGVAAGLMTKTNIVGYIAGYANPSVMGGINSFALGCRSVNPECKVPVIVINEFFDPPKTTQAASTLIDGGADVLRAWVDDPSLCTTAKERGVLAIPDFADASKQCGDALVTSTKWDFSSFFVDQFRAISNHKFVQEDLHWVDPSKVFSLGKWGPKVPKKDAEKIQATLDALISGNSDAFKGPILDDAGTVRVSKGESLSREFIYGKWDWTVQGVIMSKG